MGGMDALEAFMRVCERDDELSLFTLMLPDPQRLDGDGVLCLGIILPFSSGTALERVSQAGSRENGLLLEDKEY